MGQALAQVIVDYAKEKPTVSVYGAKYKPVHLKQNPVPVSVPSMKREPYKPIPVPILPDFPIRPPPIDQYPYSNRITKERLDIILSHTAPEFLSADELALLVWVVSQNEEAIAFDDSERGTYASKYFPDYVMEVVEHKPWRLPPIRIAESIRDEVVQMLQNQLDNGNLEPSTASYRSRMFTVQKPHGKGLRIVHDLQPLNAVSVQDAMLPPNVQEFADAFTGYAIYGTMDLYSGYHHRVIHSDSRPLTACQTLVGLVQLTTLPMGYTNSMQEFQRSTSHIIHHLSPDRALAFVDDVGVKGPKTRYGDAPIPGNPNIRRFVWEYAHTLYECFAVMKEGGATASGKKLVLATPRVTIVGHECDLEGIRPHHGIVSKVVNWPIPRNVTEVRGFLGTIGVARNWIKNFARIAKPLTELTRNKIEEFYWTLEADRAMAILKKMVTEISALKKLDVHSAKEASLTCEPGKYNEGRLVLAVDSSMIAVGFVLYQVLKSSNVDINPDANPNAVGPSRRPRLVKFPLRYGSITLNEVESRYGQPKIELYGLFRALKALEHLVWGFNVLIEMDASFLKAMANSPGLPNAAVTRWVAYIQLFDLEYKHISAENHKAPDGLSRRAHAAEDTDNTEPGEDCDHYGPFITSAELPTIIEPPAEVIVEQSRSDSAEIYAAMFPSLMATEERMENDGPLKHVAPAQSEVENISEDQDLQLHSHHVLDEERGDYWKNIIEYLQTLRVPRTISNRKSFIQTVRKYFIYENTLWRRSNNIPRRVILDPEEREELIRQAHDESGHRGRDPTYKKLAEFYFWPNMLSEIAIHCRACRQCQLRSSYHPKVMINPTWVPTILRKFNLDLVEMGLPSNGHNYIVDMRDDLTGWLEARMLSTKSSHKVADFIWQDVICRFGCIPQITTDNGTEFQGAVSILAEKYGINIIRISPYNPVANGMIERGHRTWINSIWKLCGSKKEKWSRWFYPALWADRVTTRRATGFSPYYLLYGRPHLFPFNLRDETWYTVDWHGISSTEQLIAVRALQIRRMHMDRRKAADRNTEMRVQAANDYATKNARRLVSGKYGIGELVLVALKGPGIVRGSGQPKSADTWAGPFEVVKRYHSGSYQLRELDGAILKGSVPTAHLKPFYTKKAPRPKEFLRSEEDSSEDIHPFQQSDEEDQRDEDFKPEN